MKLEDFHCDQAGYPMFTIEGYLTFIPAPPPPEIEYSSHLVTTMSRADVALGELSSLARLLPNPQLLIAPYLRREAVLSCRIEGVRASFADLSLDELTDRPRSQRYRDLEEVQSYLAALTYGTEVLHAGEPLTLTLVRHLHKLSMSSSASQSVSAGEFRRKQNWLGSRYSTPETAAYVPPPPAEVPEAMEQWEGFLRQRDVMPDLIQCALLHEHFEAVHPFVDGNGRVGRLLVPLFLMERGRLPEPVLALSEYLYRNSRDYYRLLQRIRTHCDWTGWLLFFLSGVTETAELAVRRANELQDLRSTIRTQLAGKPRAVALVDHLFVNPYITVPRAAAILESSVETARQTVLAMRDQGVLEENTGRSWGRVFVANQILQAIQPEEDEYDLDTRFDED